MENRPAEKKMRKCSKCSYKGTKFNVSRHMKVHKQCPYCEYENSSAKLNIHIVEKHPDLEPLESVPDYPTFVCSRCPVHKRIACSHRTKHFVSNHKKCMNCDFYWTKHFKENLNDHLLSVHPEKVSESNPHWIESRPRFE